MYKDNAVQMQKKEKIKYCLLLWTKANVEQCVLLKSKEITSACIHKYRRMNTRQMNKLELKIEYLNLMKDIGTDFYKY